MTAGPAAGLPGPSLGTGKPRACEVLLVSCYELGRQPFALASAWAHLEAAGARVRALDAAVDPLQDDDLGGSDLVAISIPMHTATRMGVEVARRVRRLRPGAHVCFFGLYASMHAASLLETVADSVIGGEFEEALVSLWRALAAGDTVTVAAPAAGVSIRGAVAPPVLRRLLFLPPRRDGLPPIDRYARLLGPRPGESTLAGYLEASRGCLHRCRHCPITPVYRGRLFVVPREVVLADAAQQIAAGARHLTFGDPDFLNAPGHVMPIARALHAAHPDVTFDVTAKVEHLLRHRTLLPELRDLGCLFVVTAIESFSDRVLAELSKGHTRAEALQAIELMEAAGLVLRPTFVPFTPWATLDDYLDLLEILLQRDLVEHVDPIQLAIRLLIPTGSALLDPDAARPWLGPREEEELGHRWTHEQPVMDELWARVTSIVEEDAARGAPARETFGRLRSEAYRAAGREPPASEPGASPRFIPRLSEPWFCCAEPSEALVRRVAPLGAQAARSCCAEEE